jgi:photosystem II stability/assembly factor-like uncharacterized protein
MKTTAPHILSSILLAFASAVSTTVAQSPIQFTPLYEPGNGGAIVSLEISPHDPNLVISTGDMLGVATSFDGGKRWQSTFGFAAYEMGSLTFHPTDPSVVWTGSAMGPYVSRDRGINWTAMRSGMPPVSGYNYSAMIEKVVFDPDQPARLLAIGGTSRRWNTSDSFGSIWESTNDGQSWTRIATLTNESSTTDIKKGGNIVWADYLPGSSSEIHAVLDGGAWLKSTDDGRTWARVQSTGITGPIEFVRFDPTNPNIVYVTTGNFLPESAPTRTAGGVFKSSDGGATFVPIMNGIRTVASKIDPGQSMLTSVFSCVAISKADPKRLYVNDRAWNASIIYMSDNAGETWTPVAGRKPIGQEYLFADRTEPLFNPQTATHAGISLHLSIDPNNANRVYTFNTEYVLATQDGGKTWQDMTATLVDSKEYGTSWRGTGWNGWCAREVRFNPHLPNQIVLQAMDAGRAWVSDDNGQSWRYAETDLHPWLAGKAVAFARDGSIYGTTGQFDQINGLTRSRDGGKTWQSIPGGDLKLRTNGWGTPGSMGGVVAHPDQPGQLWVVANHKLYHSKDHGDSFTHVAKLKSGQTIENGFDWLEPDPTKPGAFYASHKTGIYRYDNGLEFIGGPRAEFDVLMHVDAKGRLYVPQWRNGRTGMWRYTPSTQSWQRLIDEAEAYDIATDPKDPTRMVMVTSMHPFFDTAGGQGVWFSHDDGQSWFRNDDGLAMLRAQCVEFDPKNGERFIVGTLGRGFFQATWPRNFKPHGTRTYQHTTEDTLWVAIKSPNTTDVPKVINPSFAEPTLVGWDGRWIASGKLDAQRDDKVFASGPAALRVDATAVDGKPAVGTVTQNLSAPAGTKFNVKSKLKSSGEIKVSFAIQSFDAQGQSTIQQVAFTMNQSDWQAFGKEVTIPEGTASFQLSLYVEGVGSAWLDDVELVEVK